MKVLLVKTFSSNKQFNLEDLIAIKLELSCALVKNKLYGFDSGLIQAISLEKRLKFAVSVSKSKMLRDFWIRSQRV